MNDDYDFFSKLLCFILLCSMALGGIGLFIMGIKAQPMDGYAAGPASAWEDDPIAISADDAEIIAQILYHECRALPKFEQSAVVWTILNRVDSDIPYFPDSVYDVCTQKIGGCICSPTGRTRR